MLYPSDANSAARLTIEMMDQRGIGYLRTIRGDTSVLDPGDEPFEVGGSKTLRASGDDDVTVVAAGITVHEALRAADRLARDGIAVRVIDAYSIKPIGERTLRAAADAIGRILTVEDHRPEGGLGEAVLSAVSAGDWHTGVRVHGLAVATMPASATADQQLRAAEIDADVIVTEARRLLDEE